jgi:cell division GTPase FtsZ
MKSYDELQSECDSLCAISNDKIILSNDKTTFISQLEQGNKEIGSIISDFADVINDAGEFNIDFNDLKSFIRNNKHFFHTMIRVKTDCTYDELNKILKSAIDDSYSNINFDLTEIEVICNFQINKNTPTNLVSDTRKLLEKISRTHNIKFTYGIQNTENEEEAVISLFLSNSQQTSDTYKKNNDIENKQDYNTDDFTVKNDDTYVKEIIKSATTKRITKKLFS